MVSGIVLRALLLTTLIFVALASGAQEGARKNRLNNCELLADSARIYESFARRGLAAQARWRHQAVINTSASCHRRGLPDSATMISLLLELLLALASLSRPPRSPSRIVLTRTENMRARGVSRQNIRLMPASPLKCYWRDLNNARRVQCADGFSVGIAAFCYAPCSSLCQSTTAAAVREGA